MKKFRVGLVGYGKMGRIRESIILENPHLDLVYIVDPNIKSLDPKYKRCNSFDELITRNDCDIVFLAGFVKDMAKFAAQALNAGKHVFSEKPPSRNFKEYEGILRG
jgi:predicted dehydrogenase